jgi:hypothetical protein
VKKHHSAKHGDPIIEKSDLFILVKGPLSKLPRFYVGHVNKDHHFTPLKSQARVLDYLSAKLWAQHLAGIGHHDVYVAPHEVKSVRRSNAKC